MRTSLLILPLAVLAVPAAAQATPAGQDVRAIEALADPATIERLTGAMKALSDAFLELPVGEIQAAAEGREATAADKHRTIRSEAGVSQRELQERIDQARPAMQAGMQALAEALPAMMKGLAEAREAVERAATNLPRTDYPKR